VTEAHNWTKKDIRNIPEFDIALTVSTPANGKFFVKGEKPVISIALTDAVTGAVIVPNTVIEDSASNAGGGAEGCIPKPGFEGTDCTVPRDGLFTAASVYVAGPRGQRVPVLSYPARAKVTSDNTAPWNLTGTDNITIRVKVDGGVSMIAFNDAIENTGFGADELISGDITVTRTFTAADNAFFVNQAAATPAEVANWLNANATFKERAFAYVDEALPGSANAGRLSIRSRGILARNKAGEVSKTATQRNIQILKYPTGMFKPDATTGVVFGVSGTSASVRILTVAANTDPKADFTGPTAIKYTLDNVDDLAPGTYGINVEYADAGRAPAPANPAEPPYVDYRTPSVAVATFQVKQAAAEKPIADGCTACHWSSAGTGFVLDYPRHNKLFNEQAVDQCGGCHEYHSGQNPAITYPNQLAIEGTISGGHPLSKRVHAVHNGSKLNYPVITVAHEETANFGRNWNITYPMNIRNCESCHPAATTSGTWKANPNRFACLGCHDSDAATAHMDIMTNDPTPNAPFSGDEVEACKTCH
jgi:predicted CXXCH cytochrome family protein